MGFDGPDRTWEMGSVGDRIADDSLRKAMEEQQAEGVLRAHLVAHGEVVTKLELTQRRGDNWFEFWNPTTRSRWVLDANPTHGVNHWLVTPAG